MGCCQSDYQKAETEVFPTGDLNYNNLTMQYLLHNFKLGNVANKLYYNHQPLINHDMELLLSLNMEILLACGYTKQEADKICKEVHRAEQWYFHEKHGYNVSFEIGDKYRNHMNMVRMSLLMAISTDGLYKKQ
jgi:hypothetical protein